MEAIDKEEFIQLYITEKLTAEQVGRILKIPAHAVWNFASQNNIKKGNKGKYQIPMPSRDELTQMYVQDRMSMKEIASLYRACTVTVMYWLRRYDIPSRRRSGKPTKQMPSREELVEKYINQQWSREDLVAHYDISKTTLQRWFTRYSIARMPSADELSTKYILEEQSRQQIADHYQLSVPTIARLLHKYNIRKLEEAIKPSFDKLSTDYLTLRLPIAQLLNNYKCTAGQLKKWLLEYELVREDQLTKALDADTRDLIRYYYQECQWQISMICHRLKLGIEVVDGVIDELKIRREKKSA